MVFKKISRHILSGIFVTAMVPLFVEVRADERIAFEFLRDLAAISNDHAQEQVLFAPHPMLMAGVTASLPGMQLFRDVYDANHQNLSDSALTSATEEKLGQQVDERFFQTRHLQASIPLPAIKLGRYTVLPNIFLAQEKTSHVRVVSRQSINATLLESSNTGVDLLFKLSAYQDWFLSLYHRQQDHRASTFSSDYISGRKTLFTFDDATDREKSWNVDVGQRWRLLHFNFEWRVQQVSVKSDPVVNPVSDHRPGVDPRVDIRIYQFYTTPVGQMIPSLQLVRRQYLPWADALKLQLDFVADFLPAAQFSLRRGKSDTQLAATYWWHRSGYAHSLQYQFRHIAGELEDSSVAATHQLQWCLQY